jgi:hypothetical protein
VTASLCADCGLPAASGKQNASTPDVCASYCRQGRAHCQLRTIARMRPVVAAAVAWFGAPDAGIERLAADLGLVASLDSAGFIAKLTDEEGAK